MKITDTWGETLKINNTLKIVIFLLCLIEILTGIMAIKLQHDPIIVERGCFSKAIMPTSANFTQNEVVGFVKEVLSYRFDSGVQPNAEFMVSEELTKRGQEQKELSQKNISQTIVVRDVKVTGEKATVQTDRLLAVGNVRSALPFTLVLSFSLAARTQANPYGIEMTNVEEVKATPEVKQ